MKRYRVIIEVSAQIDIERSYQWGLKRWGKQQAAQWARDLRRACRDLSTMPMRHPRAPEDDEFTETIRHMITGRYRVLYTIQGDNVHVLHVRGPYKSRTPIESDEP